MRCIYCGNARGIELRYDKKGRPWLNCVCCGAHLFTRGLRAIALYSIAVEVLDKSVSWESLVNAADAKVAAAQAHEMTRKEVAQHEPAGSLVAAVR